MGMTRQTKGFVESPDNPVLSSPREDLSRRGGWGVPPSNPPTLWRVGGGDRLARTTAPSGLRVTRRTTLVLTHRRRPTRGGTGQPRPESESPVDGSVQSLDGSDKQGVVLSIHGDRVVEHYHPCPLPYHRGRR